MTNVTGGVVFHYTHKGEDRKDHFSNVHLPVTLVTCLTHLTLNNPPLPLRDPSMLPGPGLRIGTHSVAARSEGGAKSLRRLAVLRGALLWA